MIYFKELTKKYKSTDKLALDSITLDINKNETICLLGPNGAGKTTLIKCLCGLILPDKGEIFIDNEAILNNKNYLQNIAVVLEGARNLYWRISVRSNLYYSGALKGISKKQINYNINKYKDIFHINDLLDRKVNTLSLGQKQKVAIFSSILLEPEILILDEPSNGLDIESKRDLINLLKTINRENNITILIASHDVDFIRKLVDRIAIINDGKIQGILINKNITTNIIEESYLHAIDVYSNFNKGVSNEIF